MILKKNLFEINSSNNEFSKIILLFVLFIIGCFFDNPINSEIKIPKNHKSKYINNKNTLKIFEKSYSSNFANLEWENLEPTDKFKIRWDKLNELDPDFNKTYSQKEEIKIKPTISSISSLNRSVVFNNKIIGPEISWLVPPGFKWNNKFKYDMSIRGHNRRKKGESFLGWNRGDAVGNFYYHPLQINDYSFGINVGMRSVFSGSAPGGDTAIGEGLSMGFRLDKSLSNNSGIAFGAEQLIHFDGKTDTGRDIYVTISKGWWLNGNEGQFPLDIATFGFGTGKLAEGNIKGLCSDILGGSGTEVMHQRRLCWAPIFSVARVFNPKFSTFFEYNSTLFLLGSSISPFKEIPLRGTFAIQISDHIHNYKINDFENLKWVFRLSLGF